MQAGGLRPGGDDEQTLREEARRFARYPLACDPGPQVIESYARAHGVLFEGPAAPREAALIRFCRRHPRSLPFLDAAAGVLAPEALLRKKLLVLSALLETTPRFVDRYLPAPRGKVALILELLGLGALAGLRFLVGAALWPLARRDA
jgi:hypothetical protein